MYRYLSELNNTAFKCIYCFNDPLNVIYYLQWICTCSFDENYRQMYLYQLYFANMISDLYFTFLELFRLLAALGMAKSTTQMWIPALEITYLIVILEQHMRYLFVHGLSQIPQKLCFRSYSYSNICTIFVHTLKIQMV